MKKYRRKNYLLLMLIVFLLMTIGYSYLSSDLDIEGTSTISKTTWDIHFENLQVNENSVVLGQNDTPATINSNNKTQVSFSVTLNVPGDFYEFTVDAVNSGSIDGMIEQVTSTMNGVAISNEHPLPEYLLYSVTYANGAEILPNHLLEANSSRTYKIHIEYNKDIDKDDLPQTPQTINFVFEPIIIQSTESASHFSISCQNKEYSYQSGMRWIDWIKSPNFHGISYSTDTLEKCQKVWGNDRCEVVDSYSRYSYIREYSYFYYDTLNECQEGLIENSACNQVFNMYRAEYTEEYNIYDTLEECETEQGEGFCKKKDDVYIAPHVEFYETESECQSAIQDAVYGSCTFAPVAYELSYPYYDSYETLEECEAESSGKQCYYLIDLYYGTTGLDESDGDLVTVDTNSGSISFHKANQSNINASFSLYDTISSTEYECIDVCGGWCAECVSPESDILVENGKTIKAKNIKEGTIIAYYDFEQNKTEYGKVSKVYIHKNATNFVRYTLSDNTYIEVTDYHPIYTLTGWKSYTGRNGYPKPTTQDMVKTNKGYQKIVKIETYNGNEDFYDFAIKGKDGNTINNYYANGILVQGAY